MLSREVIVAAKARADAATEGPWDAEVGEDIEVNALSARTQWNGNVGTPARSWRTTDRILSVDDAEYELDEAEYEQRANDAEFIAASREDVPAMAVALLAVLDLHKRMHAVFSWNSGRRYEEPCPECDGKAGVHPCGCWADSDVQYVCQGCSEVDNGHVLYPCLTVRAITGQESGDSGASS